MASVLVTGASRGIGKAVTVHLAQRGWQVFAGVRRSEDAAQFDATAGVTPLQLDITDTDQVAALQDELPERLDAVVNNAGVAVGAPLEAVPIAELRRQLDVNVVGQIAVAQAVIPRLRDSRGRIVFISSVNGRIAAPMLGPYCASKFALEAAADALRMELRPWRIRVSVVQPAQTATDMWDTAEQAADEMESAMTPGQRVLYAKHVAGFRKMIPISRKMAVPAENVAQVVEKALTDRRPRPRYAVGAGPRLQMALINTLPDGVADVLVRKAFAQP
ncbi:retinol dehydrogenase [Mycobacterium sp. MS1601]|uniref:SDR family oxidoreductase n=1 Tax=Mycobacterium sp. MS1601 TaxID=1936029 RepID=UPI0009797424|nr:SDR family oxidoreductase [Mycobacterium sp. MS1601]AQA03514.1 retinol dehydrogenase [Mycobacterium sp. MS1601]